MNKKIRNTKRLDQHAINALSRLKPLISILAISIEWFFIFSIFYVGISTKEIWIYPILIILSGTRLFALYSLLHDGIHYLLIFNKKLNDILCQLLLAWPLFISLNKIRSKHFAHHRHLLTSEDPETQQLKYSEFKFPLTKSRFLSIILKDITGINFIKYNLIDFISSIKNWNKNINSISIYLKKISYENLAMLIYYIITITTIVHFNLATYFIILWILPYITIYQALNRIRLYYEHYNLSNNNMFHTRTLKLNIFQSFFLTPHNIGFHTEHHLYPSVPNYNLKKIYKKLNESEQSNTFRDIEVGYISMIKKMMK